MSLGFVRNTLRERIITGLNGSSHGFRYVATESPTPEDVQIINTTLVSADLPEPTNSLSGHRASKSKSVIEIENATVDTITNYIYDQKLRFIGESSSWSIDHSVLRFPARPRRAREISHGGPFVYLGIDAYYHWLLEEVPSYLQAKKARPAAQTIVRRAPPQYVTELLELINEPFLEVPTYVRAKSLVFASKGAALLPNILDLTTLHELREGLSLQPSLARRVYISRRDSGRHPTNEKEIEEVVTQAGFQIVHLSRISLADQISLFANADVVIGTHGAGLANLAWCKQGSTRVVEIAKHGQPDCFARLSQLAALPYSLVQAEPVGEWTTDLDKLSLAIKSLD